ncbi:alanine--tRNA ligase [Helicobacter baculiformis]|uniref:Alanine--tRNA ligase n=1 Tax=Helicobacter baculiformis TaxID=427351 RepID=A0ABV7ZL54_9HELI|nr:alanine--tRNA ligase [Helicobacter baculiformis]
MDIKNAFLQHFEHLNHVRVPSSSLVPDDSSLLFTNAGMVQFKDIFLGKVAPFAPRATSAQLCMRAGGKHNDLENVGYTNRHHTLFEMLGNFSFFDYFKEEAIAYAYSFVHKTLGFQNKDIYISVHEKDAQAYQLWQKFVPKSHIKTMGDKDNFWQMADTGPCGYCSEIYIDQGAQAFHSDQDYFGGEGDRFLEIWNLVFMQYDRSKEGVLTPLSQPCIDTGMGLERVQALLEGVQNNFDSSLFKPLMACIEEVFDLPYSAHRESFRVLADHARSVAFLLAMGVYFDNTGRGYVLRRILRRALRHGYLLEHAKGHELSQPFFYKILGSVCASMHDYPILQEHQQSLQAECRAEEELFLDTLEKGMHLFESALAQSNEIFSGAVAFKLYDTYGFPLDLTMDMLRDKGIEVDLAGYEACMQEQRARSQFKQSGAKDNLKTLDLSKLEPNTFEGYHHENLKASIRALYAPDEQGALVSVQSVAQNTKAYVVLDKTPFYPQGGGPIGDKGVLLDLAHNSIAHVLDTQKAGAINISLVEFKREVRVGDGVIAQVIERAEIAKHHSATHLLHLALREVLGKAAHAEGKNAQIQQKGSHIETTRLRFDFSFYRALSDAEIDAIEAFVNTQISMGASTDIEHMGAEAAKQSGAVMLFEDKYLEEVRVVRIADSLEACGGVHVSDSAHIGGFAITKSSSVSAGVRRIEAVCGKAYYQFIAQERATLRQARQKLKTHDILKGLDTRAQRPTSKQDCTHLVQWYPIQDKQLALLHAQKEHLKEFFALVDAHKKQQKNLVALFLCPNPQKHGLELSLKSVGSEDMLALLAHLKHRLEGLGYENKGGGKRDFVSLLVCKSQAMLAPEEIQNLVEALKQSTLEFMAG